MRINTYSSLRTFVSLYLRVVYDESPGERARVIDAITQRLWDDPNSPTPCNSNEFLSRYDLVKIANEERQRLAAQPISMRVHYNLYLTNDWTGSPHRPIYTNADGTIRSDWEPTRGTARQLTARVAELKRLSGGCEVAYRITDDNGLNVTRAVEEALDEIELRRWARSQR
jgi:hypothetical protein